MNIRSLTQTHTHNNNNNSKSFVLTHSLCYDDDDDDCCCCYSHVIHEVSFGDAVPGMSNPLRNIINTLDYGAVVVDVVVDIDVDVDVLVLLL